MNKNTIKTSYIEDKYKSVIMDFCKALSRSTQDDITFTNGYEFVNKTSPLIVFYAKTIEDFVDKYITIYNDLNGVMLELMNEDREVEFTSFEEMKQHYIKNPNEFFNKVWSDFTSFKFEGENLYVLWGDGLYSTHSLQYVIGEIEEMYEDCATIIEGSEEEIKELYDNIIENIK